MPNPRLKLIDKIDLSRSGRRMQAAALRSALESVGNRFRFIKHVDELSRNVTISSVRWPLRTDGTHKQARRPVASVSDKMLSLCVEPTENPYQSPGKTAIGSRAAIASTK